MIKFIWFFYIFLTVLFESIGFYFINKAEWFDNIKYLIIWLVFFNLTTISFAMALKTIDLTMWNILWVSCSLIMSSLIWYFAFWEKYNLIQYGLIFLMISCVVWLNMTWIKK